MNQQRIYSSIRLAARRVRRLHIKICYYIYMCSCKKIWYIDFFEAILSLPSRVTVQKFKVFSLKNVKCISFLNGLGLYAIYLDILLTQ